MTTHSSAEIEVENVGGIDETSIGFEPGVTILSGRNATNRTSLLRAIMAALGSEEVSLKGDADEGSVHLSLDGETSNRTLVREDGTVILEGNPYLDDAELAELFAFLLESNDARRSVERGSNLHDVIMRPVDTAEIDAQVDQLSAERQDHESTLEEIAELEKRLPELESRRSELEDSLQKKREELEGKQSGLDAVDTEQPTPSELEARFEGLREARNNLEDARADLEDEERIVEALRDDLANVESELEGLAKVDEDEVDRLDEAIKRNRDAAQSIESKLGDLQSVIQFNEAILEGDAPTIVGSIQEATETGGDGAITEKLLEGGRDVICWTCGTEVERTAIEQTISLLRNVHTEHIEERNALRDTISELEGERTHIERTKEERNRLRQQFDEINAELTERTDRIQELESRIDNHASTVADLETEIDELETDDHDELLELHREANELEFEISRIEAEVADVENEIASIEDRLDERQKLETRCDEIDQNIEALRTRIERLETGAVEQFNEQMEAILDLLEYENLERIWIERVERETRKGRRKDEKTAFDLHVVRTSDAGAVYEDTVDHLSESEREVVGLVFALSGYLVHEVYDEVPFMLLDSLEAFDSDRIAGLVDYFAQFAQFLVVALLPEDAAALSEDYLRVTEI